VLLLLVVHKRRDAAIGADDAYIGRCMQTDMTCCALFRVAARIFTVQLCTVPAPSTCCTDCLQHTKTAGATTFIAVRLTPFYIQGRDVNTEEHQAIRNVLATVPHHSRETPQVGKFMAELCYWCTKFQCQRE